MADLGKDVVAPVLLTSGMIIGVRTMDKVSRGGKKRSSKSKKRKPTSNTYYCRKCKVRHRKNSKIGRSHRRKSKRGKKK